MKYFIVSDIHGFYDELIEALNKKGYDKNNPNHMLIINGDLFDRGSKPVEIYKFIESIPKSNRILIRGNHEDIYLDLLDKFYPDYYDFANKTVYTFCKMAGYAGRKFIECIATSIYDEDNPTEESIVLWQYVKQKVKESPITKLIQSDELLHYYEFDDYIVTHGFIPLKDDDNGLHYYPSWRDEKDEITWTNARWSYANQLFMEGFFDKEAKNNKILVVGHVFSKYFHSDFEDDNLENYSIYYGKNLIAIDGATVLSHNVNVLVIEDNKIIK